MQERRRTMIADSGDPGDAESDAEAAETLMSRVIQPRAKCEAGERSRSYGGSVTPEQQPMSRKTPAR